MLEMNVMDDVLTGQELHEIMTKALRHAARDANLTGNVPTCLIKMAEYASDARAYVEARAKQQPTML